MVLKSMAKNGAMAANEKSEKREVRKLNKIF